MAGAEGAAVLPEAAEVVTAVVVEVTPRTAEACAAEPVAGAVAICNKCSTSSRKLLWRI